MSSKWQKNFKTFLNHLLSNKKRRYIILIALFGIILLMLSNQFTEKENPPVTLEKNPEELHSKGDEYNHSLTTNVSEMELKYEQQLQTLLNKMSHISEVDIMVNIDSTNINVYEKDLIIGTQQSNETDQSGGMREVQDETNESQLVVIREGDKEKPLLVQTKKPEIRGVLIIAKGVDSASTQKSIIDAVAKVLGVPTYKISVMPK